MFTSMNGLTVGSGAGRDGGGVNVLIGCMIQESETERLGPTWTEQWSFGECMPPRGADVEGEAGGMGACLMAVIGVDAHGGHPGNERSGWHAGG